MTVPLVTQKLFTLPGHLSSRSDICEVHVVQSFVSCVVVCRSLFVLFLLAIVFSVIIRFTASNCPFGFFKLFFNISWCCIQIG